MVSEGGKFITGSLRRPHGFSEVVHKVSDNLPRVSKIFLEVSEDCRCVMEGRGNGGFSEPFERGLKKLLKVKESFEDFRGFQGFRKVFQRIFNEFQGR